MRQSGSGAAHPAVDPTVVGAAPTRADDLNDALAVTGRPATDPAVVLVARVGLGLALRPAVGGNPAGHARTRAWLAPVSARTARRGPRSARDRPPRGAA